MTFLISNSHITKECVADSRVILVCLPALFSTLVDWPHPVSVFFLTHQVMLLFPQTQQKTISFSSYRLCDWYVTKWTGVGIWRHFQWGRPVRLFFRIVKVSSPDSSVMTPLWDGRQFEIYHFFSLSFIFHRIFFFPSPTTWMLSRWLVIVTRYIARV